MDLQISFFVLLESIFQRSKIVVNHLTIDNEILFCFQVEHSGHREVKRQSFHQSLEDVQRHLHKLYLVHQNPLLLRPIQNTKILSYRQLFALRTAENVQILLKCGRKSLQKPLIYSLQLFEAKVFETQRSRLHNAL